MGEESGRERNGEREGMWKGKGMRKAHEDRIDGGGTFMTLVVQRSAEVTFFVTILQKGHCRRSSSMALLLSLLSLLSSITILHP